MAFKTSATVVLLVAVALVLVSELQLVDGHYSPPPPHHPPPAPRHPPPAPRHPPPAPHRPPPPPAKPDCNKKGCVCGDPKIIGGDGIVFYFHGRKDQDFCLVSDSDLHINAHFIGLRPENRTRDFTWVQALTFISGPHTLTVAVRKTATWIPDADHLEITYNGNPVDLSQSWASPDPFHSMTITRTAAANAIDLVVREKMGVGLSAVPIGEKENRVHKYGITKEDCVAHFDMQFRFWNLSTTVDGVLGQTYQPGFVNPVMRGVAMPIMGGADRFRTSSMGATDCPRSQYTGKAAAKGSAMPSFKASCGSTDLPEGIPGGMTCRR